MRRRQFWLWQSSRGLFLLLLSAAGTCRGVTNVQIFSRRGVAGRNGNRSSDDSPMALPRVTPHPTTTPTKILQVCSQGTQSFEKSKLILFVESREGAANCESEIEVALPTPAPRPSFRSIDRLGFETGKAFEEQDRQQIKWLPWTSTICATPG